MKKNKKYILFGIIGIIILAFLFSNNEIKGLEYSQDLENENYTPEKTILSGWFDGVETFWYDTNGEKPQSWNVIEGEGATSRVQSFSAHNNELYIKDSDTNTEVSAKYYFEESSMNFSHCKDNEELVQITDILYIEFWNTEVNNNEHYIKIMASNGIYILITFVKATNKITAYMNSGIYTTENLLTYISDKWYHFSIRLTTNYVPEVLYATIWIDNVWLYTNQYGLLSNYQNVYMDYFHIYSKDSLTCYSYLDALSYGEISKIDDKTSCNMRTQIQNIESLLSTNYYALDSDKVFSLYNSILSEKASSVNNFRNRFITDNFINTDLLNCSRILRLKGNAQVDKKFKIIQLYFDDIQNNNSFANGLNQSVKIRLDSFDNSNYLINKFYINLDFNSSEGYLTWEWQYRDSIAIPRWITDYHNPNFKFSDYVSEPITEFEVDFQIFLSYNATNMLLNIRTAIAFNRNYALTYRYDKIIDAGLRSTFYGNQDSLQVRYIDYFNQNNGSDYLNNTFYTHNNLAGIRTLQVNNTNFYYNFLECGYFSSILNYYTPPPLPIPEPDLSELEKPNGFDGYWEYSRVIFYSVESEVNIGNWSFSFNSIHATTETSRIYYNSDTIEYQTIGLITDDWGLFNGVRDFFNWVINALLNIVFWIVNMILLFLQFLYFGLVIVILYNFIFLYLIVSLLVFELLYNFVFYYLLIGLISIGWAIFYALIWLYYEGLREIMIFLSRLIAFFISLMIWGFTLCTGNFDEIFDIVNLSMQTLILAFLEIFYEITTNIIVFLSFIAIYTEICFLLLYKYEISKAKGNIVRAERLKKAFDFFIEPLRWMYNLILKIKNLLFGWM